MGLLLFYLFLSIGVSFLCSLFEAVILCVSPAHAAKLVREQHRAGPLLESLKNNLDNALAAILTLNTIAHTVGAAGVGAQVLVLFGDEWVAIGSAILTLAILVLSEIIPKTLGATYWRPLAPWVAYGIRAFIFITYPFVAAFEVLSRMLAPGGHSERKITRDELLFVADEGEKEGTFSEDEAKIVRNLLKLRHIKVSDIMTPRTVLFGLPQDLSIGQALEEHPRLPFSRIPLYSETIDHIVGKVLRYELLAAISEDNMEPTAPLRDLMHPVEFISQDASVADTLRQMIRDKAHLRIVNDEHGGVAGVITLEDAIETLLGVEIMDEFDSVEDMRKFAVEQWENRRADRKKARASARSRS